jgi:hypothetical protein
MLQYTKRCAGKEIGLTRYHHLLIAPGTKLDPSKIAKDSAPILESTVIDETRRLRYCGGWWLRDGTEQQAKSLQSLALEHGIPLRHIDAPQPSVKVEVIRTIRASFRDDRLELVTPHQSRQIPITSLRALDLSLKADDLDEEKDLDTTQRKARSMRGLAEVMMVGSPAGDLLQLISESRLGNPRPRLTLLGPDSQAWSIDRATVFPDLAAQGAAQSLANLLRFSGILIGSVSASCTTPETRALWQGGDLLPVRRDSTVEQQSRTEALHAWIQDGGRWEKG